MWLLKYDRKEKKKKKKKDHPIGKLIEFDAIFENIFFV